MAAKKRRPKPKRRYSDDEKADGCQLEDILRDTVRVWRSTPAVDEQGQPVVELPRRITIDEAGNVQATLV